MKKFFVIIIILVIILIGMVIYKNILIKNNNANIDIQSVNKIEAYITKLYMWKEVTGDALPSFENINDADELWLWEVVRKNLEDYELTYKQIDDKKVELFGEGLTKKFPKDGSKYLKYDEEKDLYIQVGMGLDNLEDDFVLSKIQKNIEGYEVEIIEYLEDYSSVSDEENEGANIIIRNTSGDEIGQVLENEEGTAKEFVKNNSDKFTKKKLRIKEENERLYIQDVIKEE